YRTQLEKYTKSATKNSDKYIKSMSGIASSYDVNSVNNIMSGDMSFEEFLAQEQEKSKSTFSQPRRNELRKEFDEIKESKGENLSADAQGIIDGDFSWGSYERTITGRKVLSELIAAGYHKSDFEDDKTEDGGGERSF
ncbi:MAG: hypothetical protein ACTSQE_14360, partial [Candidatus Heimdallarchaeaceae archaeon]